MAEEPIREKHFTRLHVVDLVNIDVQIPQLCLTCLMKLWLQLSLMHFQVVWRREPEKWTSKQLKVHVDRWKTVGECRVDTAGHKRLTFMTSGDSRTQKQPNCSIELGEKLLSNYSDLINLSQHRPTVGSSVISDKNQVHQITAGDRKHLPEDQVGPDLQKTPQHNSVPQSCSWSSTLSLVYFSVSYSKISTKHLVLSYSTRFRNMTSKAVLVCSPWPNIFP